MYDTSLPAVADGDPHAFRHFLARHRPLVQSLARRLGCFEIEDAVQDIFTEIWLSSRRYDGRASERTFVLTIARRRLIDRFRRTRRAPIEEPLDEAQAASQGAASVEASAEIALAREALGALRPARRDALILSACEGMSHREIAETLGIPLGTAKAHLRGAVSQLRASFAPEAT